MEEKRIDSVIFDFDGTIADTNQLIIDSWQAVYRAYTGEDGDLEYILSTFGEPLYYSMENTFPDRDVEASVEIYRNYQKTIFKDEIKAFPGMVEIIKDLKAKGYKVGIVTARLRPSTLEGLEAIGLKDVVDALVTVDDGVQPKPSPEPALVCLEKMGCSPEQSIMVGDSDFDMGCGRNAGMTTVLVAWSAAAAYKKDPPHLKADYVIHHADALWEIISQEDARRADAGEE